MPSKRQNRRTLRKENERTPQKLVIWDCLRQLERLLTISNRSNCWIRWMFLVSEPWLFAYLSSLFWLHLLINIDYMALFFYKWFILVVFTFNVSFFPQNGSTRILYIIPRSKCRVAEHLRPETLGKLAHGAEWKEAQRIINVRDGSNYIVI